MSRKTSAILIGLGSINLIHGILHILQFIQSILLVSGSFGESRLEKILHNPIFSLVWAVVGLFTLYIGIKDFKHHKQHHD